MAARALATILLLASTSCGGIAVIDGGGAGSAPVDDPKLDQTCGGPASEPCGPHTYCARPTEASCSDEGICKPRPDSCPDAGRDVCGCDGVLYDGVCKAQLNGVESAGDAFCPLQQGPRGAVDVSGSTMTVMYLNPTLGVCVRVLAAQGAAPTFAVTMPTPWQVTAAAAYDTTDSCLDVGVEPPAQKLTAVQVDGDVTMDTWGYERCYIEAVLVTEFLPVDWIPLTVTFGTATTLFGVCP